MKGDSIFAWIFRLVKGGVIGTGFIIPGISGGALAVIFGVYEPLIRFFANIRKNFLKNALFFAPIGIGILAGIVLASKVLGYFFKLAEMPLVWFFIGCVLGTLPGLFQKAGEKGRKRRHIAITIVSVGLMFAFLYYIQGILETVRIPKESLWTWLMVGAIMGLSAIIPGLSSTNLILYMGLYSAMMQGIGSLDLSVLIPIVVGVMTGFLLLSKLFAKLFDRAYAGFYHFIVGLIIASTLMIVPWGGKMLEGGTLANYTLPMTLICAGACAGGIVLGRVMSVLEKKYKR